MDYPKKRLPTDDHNTNLVCLYCGKSEKEIDKQIQNHALDCKFRMKYENQ